MTCRDIEKILPGYLDQGLSAEEERLVAEHLATCAACRETHSDLTRNARLARDLQDVEPPDWLKARIMDQVRAEARAGQRSSLLRKLFFPLHIKIPLEALATGVVAFLAFYLYHATAPELFTPGAPMATVQESAPAPTAETAPAGQAALPEPRQSPRPMAKAPESVRKSTSLDHLRSRPGPFPRKPETPAPRESTQAEERTTAPAPAAGAPVEGKAKDAYLPKQEEPAVADNAPRAQPPMTALSARKASPPGAVTLSVADIRHTTGAIEKIVNALNGRSSVLEQTDTMSLLRVVLKPDQMPALISKLAELGEINRPQPTPEAGTDTVIIRLEQRRP